MDSHHFSAPLCPDVHVVDSDWCVLTRGAASLMSAGQERSPLIGSGVRAMRSNCSRRVKPIPAGVSHLPLARRSVTTVLGFQHEASQHTAAVKPPNTVHGPAQRHQEQADRQENWPAMQRWPTSSPLPLSRHCPSSYHC